MFMRARIPPRSAPQCGVPASKFTEQKGELSWAAEHVVGVGKSFGESVPAEVQKGDHRRSERQLHRRVH